MLRPQWLERMPPMRSLTIAIAVTGAVFAFANGAKAETAKLFFEGDIVRGVQQGAPGPGCVLNNQFKHLEKVVWRFRIRDVDGKVLDDKGIKGITVELPDGTKVPAVYGGHPPGNAPTDHFWAAAWIIPSAYPNGTFVYKATATDLKGDTATWEPFVRVTSQFQVMPGEIEIKKPAP
jgi:hypothetical protein